METKRYRLFSNGTEFMCWQEQNCEKCVKAVFFNAKRGTFPKYRCQIQRAIEFASVSDGTGTKHVFDAVSKSICPYRQTERVKSPQKIDENQLNLF